MSAGWMVNTMVGAVLLPPLNLILLCALGLLLHRRWPRLGMSLAALALLLLTVFSTGIGAMLLVRPLESRHAALTDVKHTSAQAIVVLGAGRLSNAPEYGATDIPSQMALARLRYAAKLQRDTGLPILVSGGMPDGAIRSEAELMADTLRQDFNVPVRWIEGASDNTAQNAEFSARLLRQAGIRTILLVTDAMHMTRAQQAFARQGLQTIAAPTLFYSHMRPTLDHWVPSAVWLELSHYALHEWIGLAWYRLRGHG